VKTIEKILGQYRNQRVFVTGHTGFKGAWLIRWLDRVGAEVRGYALAAESTSLYAKMNGDRLCESHINDIRDRAELEKSIADFQPDYIFHIAAQSLV
jgi:CDP-glucose 4,6-dehydratase